MKKTEPKIRPKTPDSIGTLPPCFLSDDGKSSGVQATEITSTTAFDSSHEFKAQEEIQKQLPRFRDIMTKPIPPHSMPYQFCRAAYETSADDELKKINVIKNMFYQSDQITDIQQKLWPHIMEKGSAMLLCDFEYLPHSMFLKPFCWLINVSIIRFCVILFMILRARRNVL